MQNQHDCELRVIKENQMDISEEKTNGETTILAPGRGNCPSPGCPLGTWESQWSSCRVRLWPSSEYQEPACEASRDPMIALRSKGIAAEIYLPEKRYGAFVRIVKLGLGGVGGVAVPACRIYQKSHSGSHGIMIMSPPSIE